MAITLDEFIESITTSGLMDHEEIQTFVDTLPMENRPRTAEDLAKELYRLGKLTKFQAQAIYQKKIRGLVVGNYVVLDKLGKGGMGAVYKAQHKRMKRVVALKMLPSTATKSSDAVKRFQREVEAAAKLSHPNIVPAYDADEAKGVHFLVMEYVEGQDLHALVKGTGTLSVPRAVDYTIQVAKGLEYAHSQGVIHRDIKPHNLLLDKKGTVKILDMGLARIEEAVSGNDPMADDGLTRSGQVMGTLDYMPPEQALDTRTADIRADIYGLGCTLHYLLIGRPPFGGDTVGKKMLAHREHPIPSLRGLRSDVPESLDVVFQKMLAKRPEDRQQSMAEVVSQMQGCTLHQGLAAPSSLPPGPSPYAETVAFQQEDTDPPAKSLESLSPFDELFAGESVQITERLVAPSLRAKKPWTNRRNVVIAAVAGGVAVVLLLLGIILKMRTSEGTLVGEINEPGGKEGIRAKLEPVAASQGRDPEREAAQWVLGKGGKLSVAINGQDREVKAITELPKDGFTVVCVFLSGNKSVGDDLFTHLKGLTNLGRLELDDTQVTDQGLEQLKSMESLVALFLSGTGANDATLEHLGKMKSLKILDLNRTAVTDVGLGHLEGLDLIQLGLGVTQVSSAGLKHLRGMKSLRNLYLSITQVTDEGLVHLKGLESLADFHINGTKITDAGLQHLSGLTNLWSLVLTGLQVSDAGLGHLRGIKKLQKLSVGWTGVTDQGLQSLKGLQELTLLDLRGTQVTAAGVAALKAALPKCEITWEPSAGPSMEATTESAKPPGTPSETPPPPAIVPFDASKAKEHQEVWARHLGVSVAETNSIGMKLVLIPPGEFMMGSTPEQIASAIEEGKKYKAEPWYIGGVSNEALRHSVEITKPFHLGVYEVTQAEYEQVVGSNPSDFKGDGRRPVENVSWFDAVVFCNRLSERERIQPYYKIDGQTVSIVGGNGYRLPTEAEWEYACRAGTTTKWSFGDDESVLGDYAWYKGNSGGKVHHKVGEKKSNSWGLCDMHGNLSEWCWDWLVWGGNQYEAKSVKDPMGQSEGEVHALRGGVFAEQPGLLRSACRGGQPPGFRNWYIGFRLARACN